jgi:integrase/recombinase XerD
MTTSTLPALVQEFFTDRLCNQMEASPNTIAAYRDTFRLLLRFAGERVQKAPTKLTVDHLNVDLVGEFLAHVQSERGNSARSRNARLASIRSFFRFVAMREPAYLLHCQKVLAMPGKRYTRRTVEFLDRAEMNALLGAPDRATWTGRRDHAVLSVALQTGLRVSEIIGLRRRDIVTGPGAHVRCEGKDRKQRCTPLRQEIIRVLDVWLKERAGAGDDPLFPTVRGTKLSRDALECLVRRHTVAASKSCPSLRGKRVSPHGLRHSTAMELLHHGVDQTVIALWLGHESVETTQIYMHADLRLKEKALARVVAPESTPGRYRPDDTLLAFLEAL